MTEPKERRHVEEIVERWESWLAAKKPNTRAWQGREAGVRLVLADLKKSILEIVND